MINVHRTCIIEANEETEHMILVLNSISKYFCLKTQLVPYCCLSNKMLGGPCGRVGKVAVFQRS